MPRIGFFERVRTSLESFLVYAYRCHPCMHTCMGSLLTFWLYVHHENSARLTFCYRFRSRVEDIRKRVFHEQRTLWIFVHKANTAHAFILLTLHRASAIALYIKTQVQAYTSVCDYRRLSYLNSRSMGVSAPFLLRVWTVHRFCDSPCSLWYCTTKATFFVFCCFFTWGDIIVFSTRHKHCFIREYLYKKLDIAYACLHPVNMTFHTQQQPQLFRTKTQMQACTSTIAYMYFFCVQ